MTSENIKSVLNSLLLLTAETEIVEFKEAKNTYDLAKLGKYFSALSNEANLKGVPRAWLVFGIEDKRHDIVGTTYRQNRSDLDSLKGEIGNKTMNRITFIEIHELVIENKRVVMFEIPPAPRGIPITWDGHYYARDGEELVSLNLEKIERIRAQKVINDWSAVICSEASIEDLDPKAIAIARQNYAGKFPDKAIEISEWDDLTFLNKAKLAIKGKVTRTAIMLLGKEESEHFLNPVEAKIRWVLKDSQSNDKDYFIASMPLLLAVDKIYQKIRKLTYRYIKDGTLFPDEIAQYDPYTIREAINNCIAHQDYAKGGGRINVIEKDDELIFSNIGTFIPNSVEEVVIEDSPEEYYRNPFLATAMFNLRMVDTAGGGIRKMFLSQKERFFPMPDYEFSNEKVKLTIIGKILDEDFARVLVKNRNLNLLDILMLDKVQKQKALSDTEIKHLRNLGLIEGRKPNFYIAAHIASGSTDEGMKAQYIKQKGLDDEYYKKVVIDYLQKFGSANRQNINILLLDKLPSIYNEKQKNTKITNMLSALRSEGKIQNDGSDRKPHWVLIA
jgi:ATP-dependent DNA helicase RecG